VSELQSPIHVVQALNDQRGCPFTMERATEMGVAPVCEMSADDRKREYYYLLDQVLEPVIENVRGFRERFPHGLVEYDADGNIVSSLDAMRARTVPAVAAGDFVTATYWAHNALYRTIDIATEQWLANADTSSPEYKRINTLVDDERKSAYGGVAIQKRVSSAANQTVLISASMQRMSALLAPDDLGRPITPAEMMVAHNGNMRFAMPMTQLHLLETRPLREVFGMESLPGGQVEMYTNPEYFIFHDGALHPNGRAMVAAMATYAGVFPDGRVGCPGRKYVPEIWEWAGEVSGEYAMPALAQHERNLAASGSTK
jgi:hypothetical protein